MRIRVLYFAVVRERVGHDHDDLDVAAGTTAAAVLDTLSTRHPAIAALRRYVQIARNQTFVPGHTELTDGDELALIPPVSGGAGLVAVREAPLDVTEVVRAVMHEDAGGIVSFIGVVRRHSRGQQIERLEYEAYRSMAETSLRTIAQEIEITLPGVRIAIVHRVGLLLPGDLAVVLAASAPHRADAFTAARETIERLKRDVPIWKKEFGEDGATWIGLGP